MRTGYLCACALLFQFTAFAAHAALGADASSVEGDRASMKAEVRVASASAAYTVHEIRTPMQTLVREYVSSSGRVFAVAWQGPLLPDLRQTLGAYYPDYQAAAAAPQSRRRLLHVQRADLVIHSAGHMRAFAGYAYLPGLLPANLSLSDIK